MFGNRQLRNKEASPNSLVIVWQFSIVTVFKPGIETMAETSARHWRRAGAFAALISLLVCSAVVINGGTRPVELGSVAPQEAIAQPPPLPAAAAHPEALALAGGAVAAQPSTTENAGSSSSPPSIFLSRRPRKNLFTCWQHSERRSSFPP